MRKWLPLIILASAQFVMVLDSSVMNVSISQIVADGAAAGHRPNDSSIGPTVLRVA